MRKTCGRQIVMLSLSSCMMVVLLSTGSLYAQPTRQDEREQIGVVLGQPIFRDEIRKDEGFTLRNELHRLFTTPVLQAYRQQHKAELEPTESEITSATEFFDRKHRERILKQEPLLLKQLSDIEEKLGRSGLPQEEQKRLEAERMRIRLRLDPPGRFFALFILHNWKLQKHLYERYGGGRILWQQAGVEAFDAYRTWLETHERQGDFTITDQKLRSTFYEYWTTMNHGSFLSGDKSRIRNEFLDPEWMRKPPEKE